MTDDSAFGLVSILYGAHILRHVKKKKNYRHDDLCVLQLSFFSFTTAAPSVLVIRRHNLEVKILLFEIYSSS